MRCCIDKCLIGWAVHKVATVCRERCGGQGMLASNRLSEYIGISYGGTTAEGDNRVLMLKIVKDMMSNIRRKLSTLPQMTYCPRKQIPTLSDITQIDVLYDLLKFREIVLYNNLMQELKQKTKVEKKSAFDVFFFEVSDSVQNLGAAYGDRTVVDSYYQTIETLTNAQNKDTLNTLLRIFALETLFADLGFYLKAQVITGVQVDNAQIVYNNLIKRVAA